MVEIKKEDGCCVLNGKRYWAVYECDNLEDKTVNPNYLWVIKRDEETNYAYKMNIYCVNDNKFLFEVWYDDVYHGHIRNGECFYVGYEWYDSKGEKHKIVNKADIHDGHLLDHFWKSYKEFWKESE